MNPEALQYSFDLFSKDGYSGSIEDYKSLISTDDEALNYSFNLFEKDGYSGDFNSFKDITIGTDEIKEPVVEKELFNWKPSLSAEEYEALPLMDKERANWEKFKEIELNNQKEEVVKSDVTADTKAFSSLEDIPKYEGLTQNTTLEVDKDGLYDVFIEDESASIYTDRGPGRYGQDFGVSTSQNKRKANKEEMEVLLPAMDALQKEAFKNLQDYGFSNENALGSDTYTISTEQHAIIKDKIYDKFVEKAGIPIDKGSFDFLYNETIVDNKDQVERDYKSNRIRPESTEVSPEFKELFVLEADKGKSEVELTSDSLKAKQFEITKELNNINNVLIPQAVNRTVNKDESSTKRNRQLDDLNKRKIELENDYKDLDKAIEQNATSTKVIGGWMPGDPLSFQGKPRTYKEINEELNSKFFNMQGRSEESTKKLNKVSQDVENTAGVRAQNLINENPALSQREAVEQLFNNELLYLQQFEADGRNSFVDLKFTPEQLSGGNPMGAKVLRALDANGLKKNIDDSGNINISLYDLRAAGIDSRNFEGYFDELANLISDKDLSAVKMYNEEVDEVTVAARTFRNLAINNVDVGAIEKPDGFVNLLQTGAVATLETLGMSKGEAEEFLTGTTEGTARTQIDNLDRAIKTANNTPEIQASMGGKIELTEDQKENISMSMTEEVTSGIGGFVPDLMILGATGGVMNAMGYAKLISKMSPMAKFITGAVVEEAKMQTILGMKPGGGATFYTLGAATSGIKLKGAFAWMNPLFQKVIKAGPIGAISAEGAGVAELAYESFMGDKNFKAEFDEMYKDFSTVSRRAIVNSMVFGLTGFTHVKRGDFMTTQRKYEVISELKNEVNNLMGQKLDFVDGFSSELKVDKDGVVIPDALKPKKQFKDLSPKDQKKFAEYTQRIQTLNQEIQAQTMHHKLDPNSKNFEKDFDKMITEPMNRAMKALVPNFEGVKVKFGRRSDPKTPMFKKNFDSAGNTAQYNPKTKEMFFDLDAYTAGKPPHEFTHVALGAYLEANPGMKLNFTKNLGKVFEGFNFGEFEGTELAKRIKERYNIDLRTWKGKNLAAEEYLAFMGEFLADPKVYYSNPDLASTFMNQVRLEVKDFLVEAGLKTPNVKTAKDVVQLLGMIGEKTRMGGRFEVKMQTLAKLDEIDVIGAELVKANREAEGKKVASKDLTKEPVVSKSNKEIANANTKIEEKIIKAGDTRVRDIKDQELLKEIKKELSKNNIGKATQLANQAARSAGAMALEPSKRVSAEEFRSGYEEQLARLIETYKPIVDGERIPFGAYMQRNLKRRYGQILQQAKRGKFEGQEKRIGQERAEGEKEFDIKSEDATPEDALIASQESSFTDRKGITVSKKLGNKADKVVAEIKRKIPVEKELQDKFLEDKTYKSLKDLAAKETQEMFGIKPKPGNLTKSDVKNAQIFINNNPDLFYGLLPKQHTTKRVNVGTSKEPKYVTRPDKATGVQDVLLNAFYNKGTRKDNLTPWTKKPARDVKTSEFLELFGITERGNPNLYVKNSNVSSRIKALVEQTGRIITNQTVREVLPEARLVGEGRSKTMASKDLVVKEIKRIGLKDYSLEKLEKDLKLIASNKETKRPKEVEDFLIDYKRSEMVEASQETPTFKSESKLFKGTKFKNQDVTFEDIFNSETGKGVWGQVKRNGKKIYEEYDLPRIEEQIELAIQFAEVFPKAFLRGENLMQTFFMGTRSTAKGVKTLLEGTSRTPKYVKGTVDPKTGIGTEIGSVASIQNQRARLEKALGSGKTSKFFKNLIADYKPEGVQKGALKKAMEKASTDAERIDILQKAINKGDNKIKSDLYYAIESAKQEWLYSSKDKNEFIKRAKFIYQGASSNTNLILGSSRQFVPIEAVYFIPGEKFSFERLKLEHLKSSLKQSMDAARAVVEGRFIEQGRDIMSDYKGIISEKKYLDIIDKIGGTTNNSGLARMTADLNNLKNYRTVESGFKETLYDKIIKETAKEINEKSSELENSFIADQVARYIAEPTPSNEIILKSKIKNKANLRKLKFQNKSVVKEASMASKDLSQSEMLNELNKRDKAFRLANERSKTIKKIRVFDFDDTLAKSKSLVFYNRPNTSGKPSPKRKAIFMIGGPGSGKSNIGKGLELGREGWKVVNQDIFIESEKAKAGLPEVESAYSKEQKSQRSKIGFAGRKAAEAKMEKYRQAGEGMIIDGTGASYNATMKKVNKLKEQGYEVFMVHAETSTEAAMSRNRSRKERSLPDFIVEKTSKAVKESVEKYRKELADKFIEIDTETIEYGKPLPKDFVNKVKTKVYENERGVLNAEEFAKEGKGLIDKGFVMDFSDFNIVREGERGPMFDIAKKIEAARGTEDVFVLTARAPESQLAIYEFLKSEGLDIPIENITGLGKSEGKAKADWIIDKASEGYNDFFFADDAKSNIKAVRDVLEQLDVKSKVQQVYASKDLSRDFNKIIEESTGIGAEKVFSDIKAQVRGAKAKRQRFFIPPSAEDMLGLVYTTLGKGKKGEAHLKFYQENLFDPYTRAMENLSTDRVNLMADFKALKKELDVPKDLTKKTESGFTNEQAVRVHLWNKMGEKIPGLSETDLKELNDIVEKDPKLQAFADQILSITKGDGYSVPKESWAVGTITTDLIDVLNTKKRGKYLQTWKQNKDFIYSKENLNKLEAAYGPKYRAALENSLRRMESGSNRLGGGNRLSNQVLDYINNSTGAIMFFNARSAVLQTISAANFINWGFNNPFRAGKAFANQPQYWKDFTELMNSDYLKDRRNGLKLNINESEIANAAKTSGNKAKAALNYILEKGYLPTKYADSFAIASGGATFYRNRINDLIKNEGKTEAEAKEIAMKEFRQVSEMSQQSSDPSKISQQQSSDLGRVVLQFANTPMQYARIQKRAVQDIANGRGDLKTNISKIAYYGFLQNMLFNGLQQAVTSLGFGDEEMTDAEEKKLIRAANGMLDSSLRGLGMAGVTAQVLKNLGIDIYDRSKRDRPEFTDSYKKLLEFSPAIKSKLGKFQSAAYPFDSKKRRAEVFEKGFSLDNPAYESMAKVITGTTNLPLDRLYSKVNNLSAAMDEETETWQSIAMFLGWPEWQIKGRQNYVEAPKTKEEKIKIKEERSKIRIKEAKGSTDYKTLKKLNKQEQVEMLLKLGYPKGKLRRSNFKEADLIKEIIKRNKRKEQ